MEPYGGTTLREVDSYKYLGTTLDATLNGNRQLAKLSQTLALKLTTFKKLRKFISEKSALLLYKTTILPVIDYNNIIYGLLTKQQKIKLQRITIDASNTFTHREY